jgi:hypothetical protein
MPSYYVQVGRFVEVPWCAWRLGLLQRKVGRRCGLGTRSRETREQLLRSVRNTDTRDRLPARKEGQSRWLYAFPLST